MGNKSSKDNIDAGIPLLSDKEMQFFRELIYEECGIELKDAKRSMMSSRLYKRLKKLGLSSYQEYYDYIHSATDSIMEIISMIDVITTNKTDFFREPAHFEFLKQKVLPEMTQSPEFKKDKILNFWSAGCSSGQEPYTLAMVLDQFFSGNTGSYKILATDIAHSVLSEAKRAVYSKEIIDPIPGLYKNKYLMTGKGKRKGQYRVVPELRQKVIFGRLNFMDDNYGISTMMDVVFCRNVIIYFDWQTKVEVITKLYRQLRPGGYLFVGHSETLNGVNLPLNRMIPTVFQKPKNDDNAI